MMESLVHTVWKIDAMSNGPLVRTKRPPKEQRNDTIAESARRVFCQRGYEKASIAEIARNAEVAEGTIYRYFDGKRSLLYEVLRRHYSVVFEEIDRTLPGIQGQGNRLRYLFSRFLQAVSDDRDMCGLITCELRQSGDSGQSIVHDMNRHYAALLVEVVNEGKQDGSFRKDTSASVVRDLICGGLELMAWSYMITGREIDVEAVAEKVSKTLLVGIESKDDEKESLGELLHRLERVTDRIDSK